MFCNLRNTQAVPLIISFFVSAFLFAVSSIYLRTCAVRCMFGYIFFPPVDSDDCNSLAKSTFSRLKLRMVIWKFWSHRFARNVYVCVCIGCRCYLLWARAHTHTSTNVIVYEKQLVDEYWCVLAGCIPSEFATWAVTKRRRRKKKRLYVKKIDSCVGWTETTKTSVAEFRVKRFHHSDALKRRCNLSCSYAAMRHNSTHSNTTLSIHTRGFFFCFSFLCIITARAASSNLSTTIFLHAIRQNCFPIFDGEWSCITTIGVLCIKKCLDLKSVDVNGGRWKFTT